MTISRMLVTLTALAGCVSPYRQPDVVLAREDYGVGWDKEVAFYNIQEILRNNETDMTKYSATSEGIFEETKRCHMRDATHQVCATETDLKKWDCIEVVKISPFEFRGDYPCLELIMDYSLCPAREGKDNDVCARDGSQAAELKRAIDIYLRERKQQ